MKLAAHLTILFALILIVGCRSAGVPGEVNHAAVQVTGHDLKEIQDVTSEVFQKSGYTLTSRSTDRMTFTRPGTQADAARYGGWSGDGVLIQVRVEFSPQSDGACWVKANAFAEQDANDPFFRTESRAMTLNRRPYQKLLNEVAKQLE